MNSIAVVFLWYDDSSGNIDDEIHKSIINSGQRTAWCWSRDALWSVCLHPPSLQRLRVLAAAERSVKSWRFKERTGYEAIISSLQNKTQGNYNFSNEACGCGSSPQLKNKYRYFKNEVSFNSRLGKITVIHYIKFCSLLNTTTSC